MKESILEAIFPSTTKGWVVWLAMVLFSFAVFYGTGFYSTIVNQQTTSNDFKTISPFTDDSLVISYPQQVNVFDSPYIYFNNIESITSLEVTLMEVDSKLIDTKKFIEFPVTENALNCDDPGSQNKCIITFPPNMGHLYFNFPPPNKSKETYITISIKINDSQDFIDWNTIYDNCPIIVSGSEDGTYNNHQLCIMIDNTYGLNASFVKFITQPPWDNIFLLITLLFIVGLAEEIKWKSINSETLRILIISLILWIAVALFVFLFTLCNWPIWIFVAIFFLATVGYGICETSQ